MSARIFTRRCLSALPLALAALGCGGDDEKLGSVMLAITTDLYINKDVNRVDIVIQPEHGPLQSTGFNLFPELDGRFLPGTFAIVEGSTPGELVRVRVIARRVRAEGTITRVVREAAVRVPRQRTALLSMPVQWLCDGHVQQDGQLYRSDCEDGETCVAGTCQPDTIDETTLPDYQDEMVFGGGTATGGGSCFDTKECFEATTVPALDLDTCVLDTAVSEDLNVALMLPQGGDGHCTNSECWIPLDAAADGGWYGVDGGAHVQLPRAVCTHVRDGGASVHVSHDCTSKAALTPTCGPWTLVGTEPGDERPIEGAPLVLTSQSLASELERASQRVARTVAEACAAITSATPPENPTPADVTQLCESAQTALSPLDWYHVPTRCWPDHRQQLACERACQESCEPGELVDRCDPNSIVGSCDGTCDSRQCLGSESHPADCSGACAGRFTGTCEGSCVGACVGVCADPGADGSCAGVCAGTCTGLCQGRGVGRCEGTCDGDPNLPVAACSADTQCQGACSGTREAAVCQSPLLASSCELEAECAADCRAMGHINVGCEPSTAWVLPSATLDAARAEAIGDALAALLPVSEVEGPAMLEEANRIGQNLSEAAMSGGDSLASANALVRIRAAADRLQAATAGAEHVIDAAGDPHPTPGATTPNIACEPSEASGTSPLIDDFEDGNSQSRVSDGRDGDWHIVRDNSEAGQLSMSDPPVPESGGVGESTKAMHLSGSNFTEWGAGLALELRREQLPYDASNQLGLQFWARGAGPLHLIFVQQNLATGHACATCGQGQSDCGQFYGTQVNLSDQWTKYTVPWSLLTQATVGTTAFSPDQLMLIKFEAPPAESFEFWLDDVSFL